MVLKKDTPTIIIFIQSYYSIYKRDIICYFFENFLTFKIKKERVYPVKDKKRTAAKRIICAAAAVLLVFILFSAGVNIFMTAEYKKLIDTAPADKRFDCILILGAKVFDGGGVSAMLADRLDIGIQLYFAGVSDRILVSGDHGQDEYDEVNTMKAYCTGRGVPSEAVFMDHAGFSTYDSVVRAKEIFGCESVMIVTQEYHLYRALYIAKAKGLDAYGASATVQKYAGQTMRDAREFAARIKDVGSVVFNVKPKYEGEKIPISGSGDATNDK